MKKKKDLIKKIKKNSGAVSDEGEIIEIKLINKIDEIDKKKKILKKL